MNKEKIREEIQNNYDIWNHIEDLIDQHRTELKYLVSLSTILKEKQDQLQKKLKETK